MKSTKEKTLDGSSKEIPTGLEEHEDTEPKAPRHSHVEREGEKDEIMIMEKEQIRKQMMIIQQEVSVDSLKSLEEAEIEPIQPQQQSPFIRNKAAMFHTGMHHRNQRIATNEDNDTGTTAQEIRNEAEEVPNPLIQVPGAEHISGIQETTETNGETQQQTTTSGTNQEEGEPIVAVLVTPPDLVTADPLVLNVSGSEGTTVANAENPDQQDEVKSLRRRVCFLVICVFVLLGGVVAGIVIAVTNRNNGNSSSSLSAQNVMVTDAPSFASLLNQNLPTTLTLSPSHVTSFTPTLSMEPSLAPTNAFQAFAVAIIQEKSPTTTFENATSPQSLALEWIVNRDEFARRLFLFNRGAEDRLIQRFALATLWYATGGPTTWDNDGHGWLNGTLTECDWNFDDFECLPSSNGDLIMLSLFLFDDSLNGTLPLEMGLLTSLTRLVLGSNALSSSIPSEVARLSALTWLSLDDNQLTGTVPSELRQLTALTALSLSSNQLSGTIPFSDLGQLTKLEWLNLSLNRLTGRIPASDLAQLTSLERLILFLNQLTGTLPSELGLLTELAWLDLAFNGWNGSLPFELGELTDLTFMNLARCELSGSIPSEWNTLTALTGLYLSSNQLIMSVPSELGNLTALQDVGLFSNQLSGNLPSELGQLTNLTELRLGYNRLDGEIPSELGNLVALQVLSLNKNQLIGGIPSELGRLTALTELSVAYNEFLGGTIPPELGKLTALTLLDLSMSDLTGSVPSELKRLTGLELFFLNNNTLSGTIPIELCNSSAVEPWIDCGEIACECCIGVLDDSNEQYASPCALS